MARSIQRGMALFPRPLLRMLACSVAAWFALSGCAQAQQARPSRDVASTARTYLAGKLEALSA
ncbi:MAG: hypothetical protein JWR63_2981, partial [Conexibacter sp.]|nr:hypothetical protein [Conexibacter sp.]